MWPLFNALFFGPLESAANFILIGSAWSVPILVLFISPIAAAPGSIYRIRQLAPYIYKCCRPPSRSSRACETLELSSVAGWHYQRPSQRSSSDNFDRSSNRWRWKLQELQLWCLFPAGWIIAIRCSKVCRTLGTLKLQDWTMTDEYVGI